MIIDAGTGGRIKIPSDPDPTTNDISIGTLGTGYHGKFSVDVLFPLMCASGITYGMIELIRRVISCDIVGGDIGKLRKMDALVIYQ